MTMGGRTLRTSARRLVSMVGRPVRWWNALTPPERVLYRASLFLAIGSALVWGIGAAFLIPGVLFALVFFGFGFRRAG